MNQEIYKKAKAITKKIIYVLLKTCIIIVFMIHSEYLSTFNQWFHGKSILHITAQFLFPNRNFCKVWKENQSSSGISADKHIHTCMFLHVHVTLLFPFYSSSKSA